MNYKYIGPKPSNSRLLNLSGTYCFHVSYDVQAIVSSEGKVLNPSPSLEAIIKNNPHFINLDAASMVEVIEAAPDAKLLVEAASEANDTLQGESEVIVATETVKRKGGRPPKTKSQN